MLDYKVKNRIDEADRLVIGHNRSNVIWTMCRLAERYKLETLKGIENLSDKQMMAICNVGKITIRDIRTCIEYFYKVKYERMIWITYYGQY